MLTHADENVFGLVANNNNIGAKRKTSEFSASEESTSTKIAKVLASNKPDIISAPNMLTPIIPASVPPSKPSSTSNKINSSFWHSNASVRRTSLHELDKVRAILETKCHLPINCQLGTAIGAADCFFDATAQALKQFKNIEMVDVKSLRSLCAIYAKDSENSWVEEAVTRNGDNYTKYLAHIEFTAIEMATGEWNVGKEPAIWGKISLEGRMICKRYDIQMHIIEIEKNINNELELSEQMVDSERMYPIASMSEVVYQDTKTIHLVSYHGHFVPILLVQGPNLANAQQLLPADNNNNSAFQFRGQ